MDTQNTDPGQKGQSSQPVQHSAVAKPLAQYTPSIEKRTGRGKKRRYSKGLKGTQTFERRISKSAHRVTKAVEKGVREYLDERNRSSERRKDGALIESYVNVARGVSEGIADASPAITDVAKAINSKRTRKVMRNVINALTMSR